jgi:hypothetical protein
MDQLERKYSSTVSRAIVSAMLMGCGTVIRYCLYTLSCQWKPSTLFSSWQSIEAYSLRLEHRPSDTDSLYVDDMVLFLMLTVQDILPVRAILEEFCYGV